MNAPIQLLPLIEQVAAQLQAAHDRGELSFGHGTTQAFDEAAWLVLWRLGLPLDTDIEAQAPALNDAQIAQVQELVATRLRTRQPTAYLTREAWLQGVPFYVDERAIVPRSLIAEVLAEGQIDPWLPVDAHRVLDLCTGNGSLAVLCALAWPDMEVTGLDLSAAALEVAQINVTRHELDACITLGQSDGLSAAQGRFDLIVCNPPYVNAESMAALPAEYLAEPDLALAGGSDGMDFIRQLLRDVSSHLTPHGVLVLEIGNEYTHFVAAFPDLEVVWLPTTAGDDQVLLVTQAALQQHANGGAHTA